MFSLEPAAPACAFRGVLQGDAQLGQAAAHPVRELVELGFSQLISQLHQQVDEGAEGQPCLLFGQGQVVFTPSSRSMAALGQTPVEPSCSCVAFYAQVRNGYTKNESADAEDYNECTQADDKSGNFKAYMRLVQSRLQS